MMIKNSLIAISVMGLIYGGPALAASSLICAAYVYCANATHCDMTGDMADKMYLAKVLVQNNTNSLFFKGAQSENGEAQCEYADNNLNWPSYATFFSDAGVQLYPSPGNNTDWAVNEEEKSGICPVGQDVTGKPEECPLSTQPFRL